MNPDALAVQQVASRAWPRGWHPGGLGWGLARDQLADEVAVFRASDGNAAGWAARGIHGPGESLVQGETPGAVDDALDWALNGAELEQADHSGPPRRTAVYDGDDRLVAALTRRGWAASADEPLRGMFHDGPPPAASESPGYRVRAVEEKEWDVRVESHRAAWRPADLPWADGRSAESTAESSFSREKYDAVRATWLYRPELDLVAEAADGSLAASCIAWFDPYSGCAEIEPLGVVPSHRRRGLAVELCREVIRRVHDLGGWQVFVNVDPDPAYPASSSAYLKAGFEPRSRGAWWTAAGGITGAVRRQ